MGRWWGQILNEMAHSLRPEYTCSTSFKKNVPQILANVLYMQAWTNTLLSLPLICHQHTWDIAPGGLGHHYDICKHLSPNHNLFQALTAYVGDENIIC